MAARVTEAEVLAIMDNDLTEAQVTPYVTSANVFTTKIVGDTSLSADVLKEIERWLAAHMIASSKDKETKEEGAGNAYVKYSGYWTTGLNGTKYGQMVLALDSSGQFAKLDKAKLEARIRAVPEGDD